MTTPALYHGNDTVIKSPAFASFNHMAVIETLQGVEVSINVDGVPLDEHIDRGVPTKSRSVECYVEAKTDAHFTVNVKTSDSTKFIGDCIIFAVTVDGIWAKSLILSKEQHSKGWHRNLAFEGTHVDCDSLRPFCFAPLKIGILGRLPLNKIHTLTAPSI